MEIDAKVTQQLRQHLQKVPVNIKINLASTQLKGREVMSLKPGDIIPLKHDLQTPLKVCVEGIPKYLGYLGQYRGNNAIKIEGPIKNR